MLILCRFKNCRIACSFQVALGIATLLMYVPVHLAATHQTGAMTLLSFAIWLMHELRHIPK
jgi:heme a synthase